MRRKMRLRYVFLLCVILLLAFASWVQAQSGGGYDLTWSTIDGGGTIGSEGGTYTLGGTIGQPDAGQPMSGGIYTLQGGFWHRHCVPVAVQVDITCQGTQAQLAWTPDDANMAYDIYRDTSPYLKPDASTKVGTDTDGVWLDTPNTCGDIATNYYYQVRATCIGGHADANHCAEFDFAFVPGS